MSRQAASEARGRASALAAAGTSLKVAFKLTTADGTVVDSRGTEDPMEFVCGEGLVFAGLDKGVQGMAVGETRKLQLQGEDAFGSREEGNTTEVPVEQLPPGHKVGMQFQVVGPDGDPIWATVKSLDGDGAVLDLNHPLAGVALDMSVTLLSCEVAPELAPFEVLTALRGDEKTFPTKGDVVTIHYAGALADGQTQFMSTRDQGQPMKFQIGLGRVLRGLDEGIILMSFGERATIRVPAVMAYGERGLQDVVPPNADLVFDVELLKIEPQVLP